jgi:hypothetical protein
MVPTLLQTLFPTPTTTIPTEKITFAAIRSTHTASPLPAITTTVKPTLEPIVGKWQLVGNRDYICDAVFRTDNTGYVKCTAAYIPVSDDNVYWSNSRGNYSFMEAYEIQKADNRNYTVMYSYNTGRLTSDILPENTYLMRI